MNFGAIHSIWTVLLIIAFVGIVIWAFSGKRKQAFDDAARQPLNEGEESTDRFAGERNKRP